MKAAPLALRRRQGVRWRRLFVALLVAAAAVYAVNLLVAEVDSGNAWGMSYGALAAALVVFGALYGARRRAMARATRWRMGSARAWLLAHLYGGALFLLLMLMHSGFSLPTGALTWTLWLLGWWTVLSGLGGLALQQWVPRTLGSGLSLEVLYERVPELVDEIRAKAEALAGECSEPVQTLFAERMAPALAAPRRRLIFFLDITGGKQAFLREFDYLARILSEDERSKLRNLTRLFKSKEQIDAHYTLQSALRLWLWLHVPASVVLLVLLALHIATVLYY